MIRVVVVLVLCSLISPTVIFYAFHKQDQKIQAYQERNVTLKDLLHNKMDRIDQLEKDLALRTFQYESVLKNFSDYVVGQDTLVKGSDFRPMDPWSSWMPRTTFDESRHVPELELFQFHPADVRSVIYNRESSVIEEQSTDDTWTHPRDYGWFDWFTIVCFFVWIGWTIYALTYDVRTEDRV